MIQREKDEIRRKEGEIQASREDLARRASSIGNQSKDRETIERLNKSNIQLQVEIGQVRE